MFTQTLVMNVHGSIIHSSKIWRQPKCPATGEQINKMQYICKMEIYLAIKKKNEVVVNTMTWMNLKDIC